MRSGSRVIWPLKTFEKKEINCFTENKFTIISVSTAVFFFNIQFKTKLHLKKEKKLFRNFCFPTSYIFTMLLRLHSKNNN